MIVYTTQILYFLVKLYYKNIIIYFSVCDWLYYKILYFIISKINKLSNIIVWLFIKTYKLKQIEYLIPKRCRNWTTNLQNQKRPTFLISMTFTTWGRSLKYNNRRILIFVSRKKYSKLFHDVECKEWCIWHLIYVYKFFISFYHAIRWYLFRW